MFDFESIENNKIQWVKIWIKPEFLFELSQNCSNISPFCRLNHYIVENLVRPDRIWFPEGEKILKEIVWHEKIIQTGRVFYIHSQH